MYDEDDNYPPQMATSHNKISQKTETDLDYTQWQVGPNGMFRAAALTIPHLHAGVYKVEKDDNGYFLRLQNVISDNIVELPETANVKVLNGMKKFWASKSLYEKFGLIYKRGILMYGPPGSGKSVTINLLMQELITNHDGIVLICAHPEPLSVMLQRVRSMEESRPIIIVLEDVDEIIEQNGEHAILSMLDGENQISNVVYLATTNYPEKLGARIINRPSRFDERILVNMPSANARRSYLKFATTVKNGTDAEKVCGLTEEQLDKWTADTENFSVAHLRELVAACFCLEQPYESILKRLKKMSDRPQSVDSINRSKKLGLGDEDEE